MSWFSHVQSWQGLVTNLLLQTTVITLLALSISAIARKVFSSALRHAILLTALFGLILSPLIFCLSNFSGLEITIPVARRVSSDSETAERPMTFVEEPGPEQEQRDRVPRIANAAIQPKPEALAISIKKNTVDGEKRRLFSLPKTLLAIWAVGVAMGALRFGLGLAWIRRSVRESHAIVLPESVHQKLEVAFRKPVPMPTVRESRRVTVPLLAGIQSPVILLPAGLSDRLTDSELTTLIVHEYAHARRGDCLFGWLQRLVGVVYWFNPLVLLLNRWLSIAREEVCDNYVLRIAEPTHYANLLLNLGEHGRVDMPGRVRRGMATAMPLFSSAWKLEDRVRGLLNPQRDRTTSAGRTIVVSTIAVSSMCLFMSAARLVAVESGGSGLSEKAALDIYGDAIPFGGEVRCGTERFRPIGDGHRRKISFNQRGELVTLTTDGRLVWWNATTGKPLRRVRLGFNTRGFAASPDLSSFAVGYFKYKDDEPVTENGVKIIDLATGEVRHTILGEKDHDSVQLLFTPDGNNLVYANHGQIRIIGTASGAELLKFDMDTDHRFETLAISPDGKRIAGCFRNNLFILDWLEDSEPHLIDGFQHLNAMQFSPDGNSLLFWRDANEGDSGVEMFNIEKVEVTRVFRATESESFWTRSLIFRKGRELLAANQQDGILYGWDLDSGDLLCTHQLPQWRPAGIAINKDDSLLATTSDGILHVFDAETRSSIADQKYEAHSHIVTGIRFLPNSNRMVTTSDDKTARHWDVATGKMLNRLEHGKWIRGLAVSPDGKWIATSSLDDTVRLSNAETMESVYELPGHGRLGGNRNLAFSPDSKSFASVGDDPFLRIWDVATGKALLEEELKPGGQPLRSNDGRMMGSRVDFTFSRDASKLLVVKNRAAFIFDATTGKELKQIQPKSKMRSGTLNFDGSRLLLARAAEPPKRTPLKNGGVRHSSPNKYAAAMMDWQSGEELWLFEANGHPGPMTFSPNGKIAIYTARDHKTHDTVFVLDASDGNLLAAIDVNKVGWGFGDAKVDLTADGLLAIPLQDCSVVIWDLKKMGAWK